MATETRKAVAKPSGDEGLRGASVTIAGPGRLGQSIGKLLSDAGVRIRIVAARRAGAARRAVRFIGSGSPVGLDSPFLVECGIILMTVADAALAPLAAQWADWDCSWRGRIVLHTSGALPSTVLAPLQRRGAAIGSLHPFQTVPSAAAGYRNLSNSFWAIEGDPRACHAAFEIAHALDGLPFRVHPARKILYHAGAVLACGAVVALLDESERMLRRSGVPAKMIRPMLGEFVLETLRNFVALGGQGALTGPAVRGDWQTIQAHLRALRHHAPGAVPVYRELLRAMARLAGRKLPRRLGI